MFRWSCSDWWLLVGLMMSFDKPMMNSDDDGITSQMNDWIPGRMNLLCEPLYRSVCANFFLIGVVWQPIVWTRAVLDPKGLWARNQNYSVEKCCICNFQNPPQISYEDLNCDSVSFQVNWSYGDSLLDPLYEIHSGCNYMDSGSGGQSHHEYHKWPSLIRVVCGVFVLFLLSMRERGHVLQNSISSAQHLVLALRASLLVQEARAVCGESITDGPIWSTMPRIWL